MDNTSTKASSPATTAACCRPDCCGDRKKAARTANTTAHETVTAVVREKYGQTATSGLSSNDDGVRAVAEAFGYSPEELSAIPAEANMGLSCGNPTATANLRPGEVVVDLGSGGGLDVFLAAQKVGPTGKAIGIDMTPEMVELAQRNAAKAGLSNVEFHLSTIDRLPLPDASADVILSNCVINLAPDKPAVFREMHRILKPGGRVAVSDIALKQPLPPDLANDVTAYVGCIAGAVPIEDYRGELAEAGFAHVVVIDSGADLNAYSTVEGRSGCCSPTTTSTAKSGDACCAPSTAPSACCAPTKQASAAGVHDGLNDLLARHDANAYAASVKVYAMKPLP